MSVGAKNEKSTQQQTSQTDPWAPAQPLLKDLLNQLGTANKGVDSNKTIDALNGVGDVLKTGNPAAEDAFAVGKSLINSKDYTPTIGNGLFNLNKNVGGTASGADIGSGSSQYFGGNPPQQGSSGSAPKTGQFASAGPTPVNVQGGQNASSAQMSIAPQGGPNAPIVAGQGGNPNAPVSYGGQTPKAPIVNGQGAGLTAPMMSSGQTPNAPISYGGQTPNAPISYGGQPNDPVQALKSSLDASSGDLNRRIGGTADGNNLDLSKNTYLQNLIDLSARKAQEGVDAQFAAAGRDLSGRNNIEVGRGVTEATLPLMLQQYNTEQGRSDAAARDLAANGQGNAKDLFSADTGQRKTLLDQSNIEKQRQLDTAFKLNSAGNDAAKTAAGLDAAKAALQGQGLDFEKQAYDSKLGSAQQLAELEAAKQKLPFDQLGWLAQLLYPAAGLGGQSSGTASGNKNSFGFSAGASDLGKLLAALG